MYTSQPASWSASARSTAEREPILIVCWTSPPFDEWIVKVKATPSLPCRDEAQHIEQTTARKLRLAMRQLTEQAQNTILARHTVVEERSDRRSVSFQRCL